MASQSKKRKCKNTHYDRGGEKVTYTRYILQEGNSNDKQTVA